MSDLIETDVLVLGSGIAGCSAALELADAGIDVTMITRAADPQETNTYYAQGGIIFRGVEDSPADLAVDIERAGAEHCYPKAVNILAREGPVRLQQLLLTRASVPFDQNADGSLSLVREGGHTVPRIIHAADATGKVIQTSLLQEVVKHPHIHLLSGHTAIDLLTPSHHAVNRRAVYERRSVVGAYILNQAEGRVWRCLAKNTILATGGLGQIYLFTSNPEGSRGDGLAMAQRAGARIINAEFIQFHPTTFYHINAPRFLISEAVRGAGARLVHADGAPFMHRYDSEWKDLAPRDVVSRSIHREMLERGLSNVYLDLTSYIPRQTILDHFPTIHKRCLEFGIDITTDLVPVVPAAHYSCGGVWVDEWGLTTMRNLYAVGEVSCTGVHGANRLASTSLLEGLVWGQRAAEHIQQALAGHVQYSADDIPSWQDDGAVPADPALILQDMSSIQHIMWNYVGLVRTSRRLERALSELRHLETEIEAFYRVTRVTDDLIGLRNAVTTAIIVASAAWRNKQSMGCHYRE